MSLLYQRLRGDLFQKDIFLARDIILNADISGSWYVWKNELMTISGTKRSAPPTVKFFMGMELGLKKELKQER